MLYRTLMELPACYAQATRGYKSLILLIKLWKHYLYSFLYDLSLGLSLIVIYLPVRKDILALGADFLIKSIPFIVPIFSFITSHLV